MPFKFRQLVAPLHPGGMKAEFLLRIAVVNGMVAAWRPPLDWFILSRGGAVHVDSP